jgi:hypothetical protein
LQEALSLTFEGEKGEHFFRSTLVQTLFYGVFSAWVLWHRTHPRPRDRFDWEKSSGYLHVPILRKLFRELADPVQLNDWKLSEVLEWTASIYCRDHAGDEPPDRLTGPGEFLRHLVAATRIHPISCRIA